MGASISSSITMGLTFCCCTATNSLCQSCLGSTAVGTTGRKRSVLLLTLAIVVAFWFQYSLGPALVSQSGWIWKSYRWIPGLGKWVYTAWHEPCKQYEHHIHLLDQCAGNAGVYRPMAVATFFYIGSAIATRIQPNLNREAWPAKYAIFTFCVVFTIFMNSHPFFTGFYLWIARIGATIFVLCQQIVLIDVAYVWNEHWVDCADRADRIDYGSGANWLRFIVAACATFYLISITGIILLYHFFDGCPGNTWIITLSLIGIIAMTTIQLSGPDGSLLTSSVMSLYVTYLAYSMVSKNPQGHCNPQLGKNDITGIVIGLSLTAISLVWTGWSWTAEERFSNVETIQSTGPVFSQAPAGHVSSRNQELNLDVPFIDPNERPASGLVMDSSTNGGGDVDSVGPNVWKLNVIMALISCFVAMTLTGWGTLGRIDDNDESSNRMANPTVGRVNMAMIGISQWLAMGLYIWTLVAPRLFPDRDFS